MESLGQDIRYAVRIFARSGQVMRLIVGQGFRLAASGLALGLVGALLLTRLLSSLLFGIDPHDPLTFAAVSLVLALAAIFACYVPARRATKVDPIVDLHEE